MATIKKFTGVIFFVCSIIFIQAHIVIDIDPSELQSIGEVLVESYLHNNLIQRVQSLPNTVLIKFRNFSITVLQLIGVTASLVGANIITPIFQQKFYTTTTTASVATVLQHGNSTLSPSKMCPHDFGCDRNVCWRTCSIDSKGVNGKYWCYTTSSQQTKKYHQCIEPYDCSPCWECLGICHVMEN